DARGGSTWIVAGRWLGPVDRGILALRRVRLLDAERRGRGALRDRLSARAAALFGHRAPLVEALVTGRRTELDPAVRERFAAAGLAHLLAISGLHVGFFAAWVARSEEHTSELQSRENLVCRLLLEKKKYHYW